MVNARRKRRYATQVLAALCWAAGATSFLLKAGRATAGSAPPRPTELFAHEARAFAGRLGPGLSSALLAA